MSDYDINAGGNDSLCDFEEYPERDLWGDEENSALDDLDVWYEYEASLFGNNYFLHDEIVEYERLCAEKQLEYKRLCAEKQLEYETQQEEKEDYYYSIQDSFKDCKKYR